jgi:hypothetical protein
MMIFNMSTSCFHKNSFHYFEDYLMTKLIFRVKVFGFTLITNSVRNRSHIWVHR